MGRVNGLARKRAEFFAGKGAKAATDCETCGAVVGGCGCAARVGASSAVPRYGQIVVPANAKSGFDIAASDDWWNGVSLSPPCFPVGYSESRWRKVIAKLRDEELAGRRAPYLDTLADYMELDTLYSDIITVIPQAVGVVTNIPVQPEAGQFLVAYYRIIARTEADGLQQVDYLYRKPRISGCPVPCDNLDRNIMSQFGTSTIESCPCGIPLLAWIQRAGEVIPLLVPVTNRAAVDMTFQVEVRGFCCDQRICL